MRRLISAALGAAIGLSAGLCAAAQRQPEAVPLPPVPVPEAYEQAPPSQEEPEETTEPEPEEPEEREELEMLARCVEAEAGNQSLMGRRLVADVILNRVDDPDFPDTIEGVITQPGQFSVYWNGGMDRVGEPSETTMQAVRMELDERGWPGVLYFTAGGWPGWGTRWRQVGDHYFCTK